MEEFDLQSMWKGAGKEADSWYRQRRAELLEQARKRNENMLRRIQRMVWMENILGVFMMALLLYWMWDIVPLLWWGLLVLFVGTIAVTYRYYRQFRAQADRIPLLDVRSSTEQFLELLRSYKHRLTRLSVILTPIALLGGFIGGFSEGAENNFDKMLKWQFWAFSIPALILMGVLFYYFIHWYYRRIFGSKEQELEEVLSSLNEEEE